MSEAKLPPGPWRMVDEMGKDADVNESGSAAGIRDADGETVLWVGNVDCLMASPEVLRAIEALPELVAAARELMAKIDEAEWIGGGSYSWVKLRRALALVDGAAGRSEDEEAPQP